MNMQSKSLSLIKNFLSSRKVEKVENLELY